MAAQRKTQIDILVALVIGLATMGLFVADATQPRGVVDGVGYAAVVALASRFGKTALVCVAAVATTLTLLGAMLVPDAGVSLAGMWANRSFAITEIWIVALLMRGRLDLLSTVNGQNSALRSHQTALGEMVRDGLAADSSFAERMARVCQTAARALHADAGAFFLGNNDNATMTILAAWRAAGKPLFKAGDLSPEDPAHKVKLQRDLVVATEDVELSPYESLRPFMRKLGLRAALSAAVFHSEPRRASIAFADDKPRRWTDQDKAFVGATASIVALIFSTQRNYETLAALDFADDGLYIQNEGGKILYANHAAQTLVNAAGFPLPPAAPETGFDRYQIHFQDRAFEVHRSVLPGGGFIGRMEDITDRLLAEAERQKLEDRLHRAAKMEAIGQLAGGVAHDFNNILGAISGFAGLLDQDLAAGSVDREFARRILSACERGQDLVEQILAFSDAKGVRRDIADAGEALRRARDLLSGSMPGNVRLAVRLPAEPLLVLGSAVQLVQLICNLVINARDALNGGGDVEVTLQRISPGELEAVKAGLREADGQRSFGDVHAGRSYCRLRVSDGGAGIDPRIMDRIFEPFFTTKSRERGTGLGLAVVHGVVLAHDGFCDLWSRPGEGTVFSIYLPLASEGLAPELGPPCRVLIVDDEIDIADLLSIGLERMGYQTVAVRDAEEALQAIAEDASAFDALLTDQNMPGLKGTELIRAVKTIAPGLRIVLCSGQTEGLSLEQALAAGAHALIPKPVQIQKVAAALSPKSPAAAT